MLSTSHVSKGLFWNITKYYKISSKTVIKQFQENLKILCFAKYSQVPGDYPSNPSLSELVLPTTLVSSSVLSVSLLSTNRCFLIKIPVIKYYIKTHTQWKHMWLDETVEVRRLALHCDCVATPTYRRASNWNNQLDMAICVTLPFTTFQLLMFVTHTCIQCL